MRLRFRAKQSPSRLEDRFLFLWQLAKGPPLEREFRFHAERRWRADFEAGLQGWRVFRLGPDQITMENVERLVLMVAASVVR
ncbi:MAG: hypothetical protein WCN98_13185 [Verrucomicrobiaceae bacterium]